MAKANSKLTSTKARKPSASTNVAKGILNVRKGWATQAAQLGGYPAVIIYVHGRLKRAYSLVPMPTGRSLTKAHLRRVPTAWGFRGEARFAVVGQVRNDVFEALAVTSTRGKRLLSVNRFTGTPFDTPGTRSNRAPAPATGFVVAQAPRATKLSPITVVSTLYRNRLLIQWYHRKKERVLYTLKFTVSDDSVWRHSVPVLDTRASKGV